MTDPLFFALPGNEVLAARLASLSNGILGNLTVTAFPDEESHLCFQKPLTGRNVVDMIITDLAVV